MTRPQLDEAAQYYQNGLDLLTDIEDAINYAVVALAFGTFLIEQRDNRDEGCPLILRAATIRYDLGLPGVEEAVAEAIRLGSMGMEDIGRFGLAVREGGGAGDGESEDQG